MRVLEGAVWELAWAGAKTTWDADFRSSGVTTKDAGITLVNAAHVSGAAPFCLVRKAETSQHHSGQTYAEPLKRLAPCD